MKKKHVLGIASFAMLAVLNFTQSEHGLIANSMASTSSSSSSSSVSSSTNVPSQPNVDDCIEKQDIECWALHPTDPSKDKIRKDAMWPEN